MTTWKYKHPFALESGESLPELEVAYQTYGALNADKNNVIWICHALTANSDVSDWWPGLFGIGKPLDPSKYFIVCANVLGGCYGTTGPLSIDPKKGKPYYHDFPSITIRDIVGVHELLRQQLGINKIAMLVGGSLGGQQAQEWAIAAPENIERLILLATNAQHSPWGIAFNEAQRMAIEADNSWLSQTPDAGFAGLMAARATALLSYRNYQAYSQTQSERNSTKTNDYLASSYQQYQGKKLSKRFNAMSYYRLSKAMDSHHVGRHRGSITNALGKIEAKTLIIGISSDGLFPISEQALLAKNIPDAELKIIDSAYGHDGFLIETEAIGNTIETFRNRTQEEKYYVYV